MSGYKVGSMRELCDETGLYLECGSSYMKLTKVITLHRTRHTHRRHVLVKLVKSESVDYTNITLPCLIVCYSYAWCYHCGED